MLTDVEKQGCQDLLALMSTEELRVLSDTVTNRLITVNRRREAVTSILTYTESAAQLLRRKKMRRDILFQFLAQQDVPISPSADKPSLIQHILKIWKSQPAGAAFLDGDEDDTTLDLATEVNNSYSHTPSHHKQNNNSSNQSSHKSESQQLAENFVPWFYSMVNSCNSSKLGTSEDPFSPSHFYTDCKLSIILHNNETGDEQEEHTGGAVVFERIFRLVTQQNIVFNPNINSDGIKGKTDPHGLAVVMCCGTVHRLSECLGVFEQSFGLIRDPLSQSNWKIKYTKLDMKTGGAGRQISTHRQISYTQ